MQAWLGGKRCFPHTNASNVWRPVAIATFEIYGWKCSSYLILICRHSACAIKIFQKWTVFAFTENWSRDHAKSLFKLFHYLYRISTNINDLWSLNTDWIFDWSKITRLCAWLHTRITCVTHYCFKVSLTANKIQTSFLAPYHSQTNCI